MPKSKLQTNYRFQKPKYETLCLCRFDLGLDLAFGLCHLSFPFLGGFHAWASGFPIVGLWPIP
jgi:hypothetical protein